MNVQLGWRLCHLFPRDLAFDFFLRVFNICLADKLNCSVTVDKWNESEVLFVAPVEAYMKAIL
jgi:hypothetical protein